MDSRRLLNQIAASQHSLITLDQALRAGLTTGQVRHRVRSGEWSLARPRVYAVAGAPATWAQAVAAATLSLHGWEFHRTRSSFDDDRARTNALVLAGWTVLEFTSRSSDATIVASVTTALDECGRSGAA